MNLSDLLSDLISWHEDQARELEREQDGEEFAEFHRNAVIVLNTLIDDYPIPYTLTAKGVQAVEGAN